MVYIFSIVVVFLIFVLFNLICWSLVGEDVIKK